MQSTVPTDSEDGGLVRRIVELHTRGNHAPTVVSGGPVPTMNGIPCVGGKLGLCTGFAQNQPSRNPPRTDIGGTSTIRN
jgi:hypothetical protein